MAIRMLASDLDGTLLDEESQISYETAAAVKKAQASGIRFMAATGRAWNTAYPILQKAGIEADYVLLNGAEFRSSSGNIIYQEAMNTETAEKIIGYLSAAGMDFEVNTDRGDFSTNTKVCQAAEKFPDFAGFRSLKPKILKIFAFSENSVSIQKAGKCLAWMQGISITSSAAWNMEITAAAARKGTMLKKAAEFYHIAANETIVFGDGENDENMFRVFCHSRAMKNAVPIIKRMGEKVIESNRDNGVAKEINQILGGL